MQSRVGRIASVARKKLTIPLLCQEAAEFAKLVSSYPEPTLYGVTDGKAVGTYLEHKLRAHLDVTYQTTDGNSALGVDFPALAVDLKVTSIAQPQSSSPFKSARQKIFGLGYSLLIFVYDKEDDPRTNSAVLSIRHTLFIEARRTADFTMTRLILEHLRAGCNADDLIGLMQDKNLPVDDIEANNIARDLLDTPCEQGYLTISNALQWRLQYGRAIQEAGNIDGILRLT
ncbi:MAG: hypothetical protein AB7O62_21405 [Pirellulales bacterium]